MTAHVLLGRAALDAVRLAVAIPDGERRLQCVGCPHVDDTPGFVWGEFDLDGGLDRFRAECESGRYAHVILYALLPSDTVPGAVRRVKVAESRP